MQEVDRFGCTSQQLFVQKRPSFYECQLHQYLKSRLLLRGRISQLSKRDVFFINARCTNN